MDFVFVIAAVYALLSIVAYAARVLVIFLFEKSASKAQHELDQLLPSLEQLISSYSGLPDAQQRQQSNEIAKMVAQTGRQMRDLDNLHRQQYQARIGDLQSMAANAGFDWTPLS